ncbi:Pentatricopeptide repeat-containing protein [Platanthera guangdongensis]|uniref:Pentatricopeptide repeat-containing protein n=1 Tax=Platanthera guangdongensis TaxID=2320717 RepID=A0ABR2LHK5_9ASPA
MAKLRAVLPITTNLRPTKNPRRDSNATFSPKRRCLSLFNSISSMRQLLQIHSHLLTSGVLLIDKFLTSEILRFSSLHPAGDLSHARLLLLHAPSPMPSSWNHVIRGLCLNSSSADAVAVFLEMRRREAAPNELTYPFVIKSCAELLDLCIGRQAHADSIKNGVESVVYVENTLMHLYGLCGEVDDARKVFDQMPHRTVVSWNTLLGVYTDSLMMGEAVKLFGEMRNDGCEFDGTTYVILLSASALTGRLGFGRWIHNQIICRGIEVSVKLGTALVHMYAKCGSLEFAITVFRRMPIKNVWTWSAMILGFAQHGCARDALDLFKRMKNCSMKPNYVTFLGVLCACSHAGLVDFGYQFFNEMVHDYSIKPKMSHYSAMVDVLGRKGRLLEAYNFIKCMPVDADAVVWRTLLNASQLHGIRDAHGVGEAAKKRLLVLEPNRCGNYVIVANMYSEIGLWEEAAEVRKIMREEGYKKMAGESCIEIGGTNQRFLCGVASTSVYDRRINELMYGLHWNMKRPGVTDPSTYTQLQNFAFAN